MKNENKRQSRHAPIVDELIRSYREANAQFDPLGMYTGITKEMSSVGVTCASCPDTKTPTDAILSGKTYRSRASLENAASTDRVVSYADAMPQQDADDL